MILALSGFRMANGLGNLAARAFLNRGRLAEQAEGFLGIEVFTESSDASVCYLSTRPATNQLFGSGIRAKHTTPRTRASKDLKLDPAYTQLVVPEYLCH